MMAGFIAAAAVLTRVALAPAAAVIAVAAVLRDPPYLRRRSMSDQADLIGVVLLAGGVGAAHAGEPAVLAARRIHLDGGRGGVDGAAGEKLEWPVCRESLLGAVAVEGNVEAERRSARLWRLRRWGGVGVDHFPGDLSQGRSAGGRR